MEDRIEKNSAKCLKRSGQVPSPEQTSIDKTNDCVMKSERGALVRGSNPPQGHSVHTMVGDMWRTPARRLIKNMWSLVCRKQTTKIRDPSPIAKHRQFSGLGEERRTRLTTSRPLDNGSTLHLRDRHLQSLALPDRKRVRREFNICEDRRSTSIVT